MKTLEQLLADWQSGAITPEELRQLKRALAEPAARSELIWEWQLDQAIYETFKAEAESKALSAVPAAASPRAREVATRSRGRLFPWLVWRDVRISWRVPVAFAVCACVLVGALALYFRGAEVGRLTAAPADLLVERQGRSSVLVAGQALYPADILRLAPRAGGTATLTLGGDATRIELAPGAELQMLNPWRGKRIALRAGELQANVAPERRWRPMTVLTPHATAKVVGTQFSVSVTGEVTRLSVLEGAVRLRKTITDSAGGLAEVLVRAGQVAVAAPQSKLEPTLLTGFLSSDTWLAPPDMALTEVPLHSTAAARAGAASNLVKVERLRGYLVAPASGPFTFWVGTLTGTSPVELWLSGSESPAGRRRLAWAGVLTSPTQTQRHEDYRAAMQKEWQRLPTQRSAPVNLVQGRRYYIEIWHRGSGIESLALGWTLPGAQSGTPAPVNIQALCPFVGEPGTP